MSFNGSGTFNINTAGQPVVTGTVISSSVFNALTADLATGLSTCITKDGQTTVTANIPMNSFKFTGLAAGTAATDSVRLGQIQAGAATLITVTGTNTYSGTMTPALSAYAAGNTFTFLVPNTNTTSCTLNIDGLGAKSITRDGTTALVAGDLVANSEVVVVYDGTQFQVLNSNSKTNFNLSGTLTVAGNTTLSGGTANGVAYLNGSKVLTTGSALTFNGSTLGLTNASGTELWKLNATTGAAGYMAAGWAAGINTGQWNIYTTSTDPITLGCQGSAGITFSTSSANRATINAAGNVTINAPASGVSLSVSGTGAAIAKLTDTSATGYSGLQFAGTGTQGYSVGMGGPSEATFGVANKWFIYDSLAGAMRMVLDTSGNLGIGTSSPGQRLAVEVSTNGTAGASIRNTNAGTAAITGLYLGSDVSNIAALIGMGGNANTTNTNSFLLLNNISGADSKIVFGTNGGTERARIDSSGNLLVKATSAGGNGITLTGSTVTPAVGLVGSSSTAGNYGFTLYSSGAAANRFLVDYAGTIFATNTTISAISDLRFKENVRDLDVGLAQVMVLKPRVFDWKAGKGKDIKGDRGFIAQEFEQVFPELIDVWADPAPEGEEPYKSVRQDLIPVLVKAMQEQQAMIEELKARIVTLENK